jgi:hypothetical protein
MGRLGIGAGSVRLSRFRGAGRVHGVSQFIHEVLGHGNHESVLLAAKAVPVELQVVLHG